MKLHKMGQVTMGKYLIFSVCWGSERGGLDDLIATAKNKKMLEEWLDGQGPYDIPHEIQVMNLKTGELFTTHE